MNSDDLPVYPTPQQATYVVGGSSQQYSSHQNSSSHQNRRAHGSGSQAPPRHQNPQQSYKTPQPQAPKGPYSVQPGGSYSNYPTPQRVVYQPAPAPQPVPVPQQQYYQQHYSPQHQQQPAEYAPQPQYHQPPVQSYRPQYEAPQAAPQQSHQHVQASQPQAHYDQYSSPQEPQSIPPPQHPQQQHRQGSSTSQSHIQPQPYGSSPPSGPQQQRKVTPGSWPGQNRSKESLPESKKSSKQKLEAELRATFDRVDVNHSGRISARELSMALLNFDNTRFQESTVRLMLKLFSSGSSSSKGLNFDQFVSLWKYLTAYKKLFVAADSNKSGDISFGEFQRILEQIGYKLNVDLVLHLFQKFSNKESSTDGTSIGKLKFDAFIELLVYLRKLTDIFKQYDKDLSGVATISYSDFLLEISNLN